MTFYIQQPAFMPNLIPTYRLQRFSRPDEEPADVFFLDEHTHTAGPPTRNHIPVDNLQLLESATRPVLPLAAAEAASITASMRLLQQKFRAPHPYRNQVLKSLINSLLYEVVGLYDQQHAALQATHTRSQLLTAEFKLLVNAHSTTARSVKFYADRLCIMPKHLTDTLKQTTGKTAGEWIEEAVMLEAKALLQNGQLSVAQVADLLHFPDQSAFSRFFRNSLGLSPTAYKQAG